MCRYKNWSKYRNIAIISSRFRRGDFSSGQGARRERSQSYVTDEATKSGGKSHRPNREVIISAFHSVILLGFFLFVQSPAYGQLRINEILAVNTATAHDPDFGEFADFIELYNASANPVNLNNYTLTDDEGNKDKWALPEMSLQPQEYLIIWADDHDKHPGDTAFSIYRNTIVTVGNLHANFKLSSEGEYLGLFNPQGQLVHEITFGVQSDDLSYGRNPQNPLEWVYFSEPTPGTVNSAYGAASLLYAGDPVFSIPGGFYASAQPLQIATAHPGAAIRFTFDGSTPTRNSSVFSGSFNLNRNYAIKARVYEPGKLPGEVVTHSYFIGENINLPVISIATNGANLFDFDFGILQNAIKDREIPATLEYFEPSGERAFQVGAGLRIFGTTIYNLPQRPLSVRFKSKYGDDVLRYQLFEDKPISTFSSFLLRNGGNDYNLAYFRDGLAVGLMKNKMDLDHQAYKPCVVFVNGEYHGIYEIRERLDEQYVAANHGINAANLDYLEDSLQVVAGDSHDFTNLQQYISSHDLVDTAHYAYVASRIDLNEFINYAIHRVFIGYRIADYNNRYWRNRDTKSPWRWVIADMEHAFGQLSGDNYQDNTLGKLAGHTGDLPEWSTFLLNNLLKNDAFRDEFMQRFAAYLNTIYQPSETLPVVDSLKALLELQMPRHIARWNSPISMAVWQGNVNFIKTFLQNRPHYLRQHLTAELNRPDSALITMRIAGNGKVQLCGVLFADTLMQGHFFKNAAISLMAIPEPGHRFVEWLGLNSVSRETTLMPMGDTAFIAVFEPVGISIIPPLIETDTTLSAALSPWYGLRDIVVKPGARLTVEAGVEIRMTDQVSITVEGGLRLEGTPAQKIVVRPDPEPAARKPFFNPTGRWGAIIAMQASDTIFIRHANITGGSTGTDRELYFATLSAYDSPVRIEHTTISGGGQPLYAKGSSAYIGYSTFHTFNACNGFISLFEMTAPVVEYCTFQGNRAPDTDAIDLKSISDGLIRHNHIYGFFGSNCDGIDLGIYAINNRIEYNRIHDCTDKGISIGSQSNALILRNVIYDCDIGVAVKDSLATAYLDQNTFFGNNFAVACYEKSTLRGGGTAYIKNTIMTASLTASVLVDEKSFVQVTYSLSDREALAGVGNLNTDPQLVHPTTGNFELQPTSPGINSGDPSSPNDPDGSRADMGAYYTHNGLYGLTVHVNELSYHPPANRFTGDWVELHNRSSEAVDLSYWTIAHGSHEFVLPFNTLVAAGGYLVICEDTILFKTQHPNVANYIGNLHFEMSNKAGKVALYDSGGNLVHSMRYADFRPWPPLADGLGATVELDQLKEGNQVPDWRESYVLLGTPGAVNSLRPDRSGLYLNELMASNSETLADEYGEYDDWFELYNATADSLNIGGLYFTDNFALPNKWQVPLHTPEQTTLPPGGYLLLWADEQSGQGLLHAEFKLGASGEALGIFQRVSDGYELMESLTFGSQDEDVAWGRYPDGGPETAFLSPTPGSSNVLTHLSKKNTEPLLLYPNPFENRFWIPLEQLPKPCQVTVLNILGQPLWASGPVWEDQVTYQRGQSAGGLLIVVVVDGVGRRYLGKVVGK